MSTAIHSVDLINGTIDKTLNHLNLFSPRKDIIAANELAQGRLSEVRDQLMTSDLLIDSLAGKNQRMIQKWRDHLTRIYLFLSNEGYPPNEFLRILDQPIDFLLTPYISSLKSNIEVLKLSLDHHSVAELTALIERNEQMYDQVEKDVQVLLQSTNRQIESIIRKSLQK